MVKASEAGADNSVGAVTPESHPINSEIQRLFQPLLPAEERLWEACRRGELATISNELPNKELSDNTIRADLLRYLILSRTLFRDIDIYNVALIGAFIKGSVNVSSVDVPVRLIALKCLFDRPILAQGSSFRGLNLNGSKVPGIIGDSSIYHGSLFLRNGFHSTARIMLTGSTIDGDLDFSNSTLESSDGNALVGQRCTIKGSVFLSDNFKARGAIRLSGSTVGGNVICSSGSFLFPDNTALSLESMCVKGDLKLNDSVEVRGLVTVGGSEITGDVVIEQAKFINPGDIAVNFQGSSIKGGLFWRDIQEIDGGVDLVAAQAGSLVDDPDSWLKVSGINLDGFRYERITGDRAAVTARSRVQWLKKQPSFAEQAFVPGPWEQLIKVMREMGHYEDAKVIAIEKQKEMRSRGLIGSRRINTDLDQPWRILEYARVRTLNQSARFLHCVYGALAGYGYRPMKTLIWMLLVWLIATATYSWGEARGLFGPTAPILMTNEKYAKCGLPRDKGGARWTRCDKLPVAYTTFDPPMYSLDVILPVVDLKQEADWAPIVRRGTGWAMWDGMLVRGVLWAEIIFGWVTSLLLVTALGRLVQRD